MIFLKENIKFLRKKKALTQAMLAKSLGVNANTISNYEKGVSTPDFSILEQLVKTLDVNAHSFLYDNLAFRQQALVAYLPNDCPSTTVAADNDPVYNYKVVSPLAEERHIEQQRIPLYDFDAVAGLTPLMEQQGEPTEYISIPNLPRCDGAVHVCGNSMVPVLNAGDIVVFRIANNIQCILWGDIYIVSFSWDGDEFTVVKILQKSDTSPDYIKLVSHNPDNPPTEIPISTIRTIAHVKASIRFNAMG